MKQNRWTAWTFLGSRGWTWTPMGLSVVLGVLGIGALYATAPGGEIQAAPNTLSGDQDGDGFWDRQEEVIASSNCLVDTDGDGFSDLEEFARQSRPNQASSIPEAADLSVAASARGESDRLQIYMAIFQSPASSGNIEVRVGQLVDGKILRLPPWYVALNSTITDVTTTNGVVRTIDMSVAPKAVPFDKSVSWFIYVADRNDWTKESAAVVDVFNIDRVHAVRLPPTAPPGASSAYQVGGSIYRPIPPAGIDSIPPEWAPSEICMRTAQTVGVNGAILTQEVTAAECMPEWDAYCSSDCAAAVGTTYQTIDPVYLVGH